MPVVFLGGAAALLLLTRLLTMWFVNHKLLKVQSTSDSEMEKLVAECLNHETHPVPMFVSILYSLACALFVVVVVWGIVSTAWWALLLGLLIWILVHAPFREPMDALAQVERVRMLGVGSEGLLNELKGNQSPPKKIAPELDE